MAAWPAAPAAGLIGAAFSAGTRSASRPARPLAEAGRRSADPWRELARELDRSRRYGRGFALIRLPSRSSSNGDSPAPHADLDPQSLGALVRSVDRVWSVGGFTYVLLPEVGRAAALGLLKRIERRIDATLVAGIATFPDDGVTSGALLRALADDALHGRSRAEREATRRPRVLVAPSGRLAAVLFGRAGEARLAAAANRTHGHGTENGHGTNGHGAADGHANGHGDAHSNGGANGARADAASARAER